MDWLFRDNPWGSPCSYGSSPVTDNSRGKAWPCWSGAMIRTSTPWPCIWSKAVMCCGDFEMLDTWKHLINLIDHHRSSNIITYHYIIMGYCDILWNIMKYMLKPFVDGCVCVCVCVVSSLLCPISLVDQWLEYVFFCTRCMMRPWAFPSRSSELDVQEAGSVSWIVNPWFQWPTPVRSWALLIRSLGCVLESWRILKGRGHCYRCLHSGSLERNVVRMW